MLELHRQWDLLLEKMREKGVKLLQAQKLVQYLRECEDVMDWINDKVCSERKGLLKEREETPGAASEGQGWWERWWWAAVRVFPSVTETWGL